MKFWGAILILSWCVTRSQGYWDYHSPLYVNKKGDTYSFPKFVAKYGTFSNIRYMAPDETDTTTYMFCKINDPKTKILIGQVYNEGDKAPHICPTPVQPVMEPDEVNYVTTKCGTNEDKTGFMHRIVYKLALAGPDNEIIPGSEFSLLVYKLCYDDRAKELIYAEYTIDNPLLLGNAILKEEQAVPFKYFGLRYSILSDYYEMRIYNTEKNLSARPELMPFALMRKALHIYENAAPLREELIEVWNKVISKIKKKLSMKIKPIKVYAGVYDRQRKNGATLYVSEDMIPLPHVFWTLFYDEKQTKGVSLIMHNYEFNLDEERHKPLCDIDVCSEVGLSQEDMPNSAEYKYAQVYCCPASTITELYPFKKVENLFHF